jgi:hypothetical protein
LNDFQILWTNQIPLTFIDSRNFRPNLAVASKNCRSQKKKKKKKKKRKKKGKEKKKRKEGEHVT